VSIVFVSGFEFCEVGKVVGVEFPGVPGAEGSFSFTSSVVGVI